VRPIPAVIRSERAHPRVPANFMVKVMVNGRAIVAKAKDLSMAGLYLVNHTPARTRTLTIAIPLPNDREIVTRCDVKRDSERGTALEFCQLDWEDLFALARYLHPRLP